MAVPVRLIYFSQKFGATPLPRGGLEEAQKRALPGGGLDEAQKHEGSFRKCSTVKK